MPSHEPLVPSRSHLVFARFEHDSHLGRWTLETATPTDSLATCVEQFWIAEAESLGYTRESILPRSATEILVNLGAGHRLIEDRLRPDRARTFETSWISGLQRRPLLVESPRKLRLAGIRLRPAGVLPFLGASPESIAQEVVQLRDVLRDHLEPLRERLVEIREPRSLLTLLACEVERRMLAGPGCSPAVRHALRMVGATGGCTPIRSLVNESGWSERHFIARFRHEIGFSPKAYARIVRFERTVESLRGLEKVRWADLAHERGYADQAHLAHEFRELADATPREAWSQLAPDGLALVED